MSAVIDSDYLIFADESGDHGLVSIDEQFPVFALVFCIVRKQDYVERIVPAMQRLKMANRALQSLDGKILNFKVFP